MADHLAPYRKSLSTPSLDQSHDNSHLHCEFLERPKFPVEQERGAVFYLVEYYAAIKNDIGVEF